MRYRLLGRSGLRVSELCLGTMTFGTEWGWGADKDASRKVFDQYVEAGGNFIDTANFYTAGTSEKFVGEFVGKERERFVVATKYTLNMDPADPNGGGNHRKNMRRSVEDSLRRLGTDYIDLYWVHMWDYTTPVDEVMRCLDDLVSSGKVNYVGISDTPAWIVSQANTLADWKGWTPFTALQIQYSLVERTPERDLLPMARNLDLAVTPWGILGSGVLTGKYNADPETEDANRRLKPESNKLVERNFAIASTVKEIADAVGKTPSQVAINWQLQRQHEAQLIPILGARTPEQLTDNLGAIGWELGAEQLARLDAVSEFELGFPHDFLASDNVFNLVRGEHKEQFVTHRPWYRSHRPTD